MDSDEDRIRAKAKALEAAGIGQGQVDLALETSTGLLDILGRTEADDGGRSIREVYTAFAGAASSGKAS